MSIISQSPSSCSSPAATGKLLPHHAVGPPMGTEWKPGFLLMQAEDNQMPCIPTAGFVPETALQIRLIMAELVLSVSRGTDEQLQRAENKSRELPSLFSPFPKFSLYPAWYRDFIGVRLE